jgi:hypothetical protein
VRGDRCGFGDHFVLEAGVELHVAGLINLLGGEKAGFLLALGGHHEAGELGRDPFLGDHQRRQRPVNEGFVLVGERVLPLVAVGCQLDRPGVPLLVLPVAIERLGVV